MPRATPRPASNLCRFFFLKCNYRNQPRARASVGAWCGESGCPNADALDLSNHVDACVTRVTRVARHGVSTARLVERELSLHSLQSLACSCAGCAKAGTRTTWPHAIPTYGRDTGVIRYEQLRALGADARLLAYNGTVWMRQSSRPEPQTDRHSLK